MLAAWATGPEVTRFLLWPPDGADEVAAGRAFLESGVSWCETGIGQRRLDALAAGRRAAVPALGMMGVTPGPGPHSRGSSSPWA